MHTVIDEGLSGANDVDVLAAAVAEDRALITLDLDFANPMRFPPHETTRAGRVNSIAPARRHNSERAGRFEFDS